nr:MAG TPA: Protein of unknown function (DUF551) [Caudoviricetes sp.]
MTTVPEEAVKAAENALRKNRWLVPGPAIELILTAALPHLQQGVGVKVKPLEWGKSSIGECDKAQTVVGSYFIGNPAPGSYNVLFDNDQITALLTVCPSLEAAKAAAQADYEARILSAIETVIPVSQPSTARELALEEILREVDEIERKAFAWSGSAFLNNELEGAEDADCKTELYSELCGIGNTMHWLRTKICALSSPDQADAGKVEGDGWMPIESAPKNKSIQIYIPNADYYGNDGVYAGILVDLGTGQRWATFGWAVARDLPPHMHPTHWRPLPSAPSQEVAGS